MSDLDAIAKGTGADARQARRTIKRRAAAASAGRGAGDNLAPLTGLFDDLLTRIAPAEARALGREIAQDLRAAQAARIRPNVQPDETPMTPRKWRNGKARTKRMREDGAGARSPKKSVRQERMFQRAAGPRYLRKESSQGEASVGFVGAMARIMAVHQYGQADTVTRDPASPRVVYPERVVLGIAPDDRARILDRITAQIAP